MKKLFWITLAVALVTGQLVLARDGGWGGGRGPGPGPGSYYSPHYMPHGHMVHGLPDGFTRLFMGGLELFYWEGMYYRMATDGYVVVPAPVGAVVTAIPPGYQINIVDGVPYYMVNGVTYMLTSYGYYQVVPPPRVLVNNPVIATPMMPMPSTPPPAPPPPPVTAVPQPKPFAPVPAVSAPSVPTAAATNSDDVFTVNIPNSKGNYTPVILKRAGNGFVGPQGEFYSEFPRVEQLKVMYGK